jgi:cytoskeletal protein CcmA (bactofilin family)
MFNKTNKSKLPEIVEAAPAPVADANGIAARKAGTPLLQSARPSSMVFSNITIHGHVTGTGDLHLDGTVLGDVKVGNLTVGDAGNIEGSVEADMIEIRGRVLGSISGKQIKLMATAYVEGDITHDSLAIEVGAYFQGRCLQNRRVETAPDATFGQAFASPEATPVAAPQVAANVTSLSSYDLSALSDLKS